MSPDLSPRLAVIDDIPALQSIADQAYRIYVPRIGQEPAPMVADFTAHVCQNDVYVFDIHDELAAYVVTYKRETDQFIENIAVRPDQQGFGYGYDLMSFAETEARKNQLNKVVLYTNVKMTENLAFYRRLGYVETERIREDGFERVYFEKRLLP